MFDIRIPSKPWTTLTVFLMVSAVLTLLLPPSAQAASLQHAANSVSPRSLILTQADVAHLYGASFRPFMQIPYGKEKQAHVNATGCRYSSGYAVMFGNFKRSTPKGFAVVSVLSSAFAYPNSSCPHSIFSAASSMPAQFRRLHMHSSSLGGVGDAAVLLTSAQNTSGRVAYTDMITFYRGTYTAMVMVSALGGKPRLSDVVGLAKTVDQRIASHG